MRSCSGGVFVWRRSAGCDIMCVCVAVAGNGLGAEGMAALVPALSKLVSLISLNLSCTYAVIFCAHVAHGRREWQACVVEVCDVRRVVTFLDLDVCGVWLQVASLVQRAW